jgi:hypothetical protein
MGYPRMSFIHGYLLAGLVLASVPVLLHLIMRQKPKRMPFPAFRFLKLRRRTNQRKLRLQHFLLLLLRVMVVAALCLALSRPRVFSSRLGLGGDRPVSAVLLFDASSSMEYTVAGVSRLEDAQQRARELLDEMDASSRVAILDSGDDAQEVLLPPAEARSRVEALRIRPAAGSLNRSVDHGLRLLAQEPEGEDAPPRLLYVFSDRTRASWESAGLKPSVPEGVTVLFIDVGIEKPRDLAIDKVEVVPAVVAPKGRIEIRVSVRGTSGGHDSELHCHLDPEPDPNRLPDKKPVKLTKDETGDIFIFEREAPKLPPGGPLDVPYHVTVHLGTRDGLQFNNDRYATFLVRGSRKLLTLVEKNVGENGPARVWQAVFGGPERTFDSDLRTLEEAGKLSDKDLAAYPVIALFQVSTLPESWSKRLAAYVRNGGGLAIIPGSEELLPNMEAFNKELAALLPAPIVKFASTPPGKPLLLARFAGDDPVSGFFARAIRQADPDFGRKELFPFVRRFWQLGQLVEKESLSILSYSDKDRSPALAERSVDKGKVILFTTPLDLAFLQKSTDFLDSSFALVLIDRVCRYLAGEVAVPQMNFRCGDAVQVNVPAPIEPPYTVNGPGLAGAERNLKMPQEAGPLPVPQAQAAGHYLVLDGKGHAVAGFSLNVVPAESDLERVPVEELEAVLGKNSVLAVGRTASLHDALETSRPRPVELLPYLMMLLLIVLALESLLGNRFYRRVPEESPA